MHHDYLATTATSFSPALYPSRFYLPTPPTPSPFSCLLHHLLTPSSVSTLRSHLLVSEVSVLVAVFSLFFYCFFLGAASLSSLLSLLDEYRVTDELTSPAAHAYREIPSNVGPLLEPPVDSSTTFQMPPSVTSRANLYRRLFSRLNLADTRALLTDGLLMSPNI